MSAAAAPAVWRRIDGARRLLAWSEAQLAAVAREVESALRTWREGWGLTVGDTDVTCLPGAEAHPTPCWEPLGGGDAGAAWIELPSCFEASLARALWGRDDFLGPIATKLVGACAADLHARLRGALLLESGRGPAACPSSGSAWSGDVVVLLGDGQRVLLEAAAVEKVLHSCARHLVRQEALRTQAALTPVGSAVARMRIALRAQLADCELEVASLQDLRVGDVVPVPHRLDAPLLVCDSREEPVFAGFLARRGGGKALELSAIPAAPAASNPNP